MPKIARQKLDLTSLQYRTDPFGSFGRLRELGPLAPGRMFAWV